jgi:hypothetical protein
MGLRFRTRYIEPGVIEGESLKIEENTGGWGTTDVFVDEKLFNQVSGHKILLWHGEPKKENKLSASFDVDKPGTYKVKAQVVTSPEGGKFQLSLNGKEVKQELNLKSNADPGKAEIIYLGTFNLQQGKQVLELKWLPTEGLGQKAMIDYIDMEAI